MGLLAILTLSVGASRIYEEAHWPSDVAGGYLLGTLMLLFLIPLFLRLLKITWASAQKLGEEIPVSSREGFDPSPCIGPALAGSATRGCRVERSIASLVVLDPQRGTVTKVYRPPVLVRVLYWLAFQAKLPYESNTAALQTAMYRRKIASLLTIHRFGKDLVAPVIAVDGRNGQYSFVTEYVPGEEVTNDEATKRFLSEVSETFAEAGLSIWQVNPRKPHAHTNVIRTAEGDLKIIDLEFAVVTPFPAPGQLRSALKNGNFPIFDGVDFQRLRQYASANAPTIGLNAGGPNAGSNWLAEFNDAVNRGDQAYRRWTDSEPRVWGRLASRVYRLLNWQPFFHRLGGSLLGADRAAETFLSTGIDRWEREGRMEPTEALELRTRLASVWLASCGHWLSGSRFRRGAFAIAARRKPARPRTSIARWSWRWPSFPLSAPLPTWLPPALRKKLLVRLLLDQVAWRLPFRLYERAHLGRWLAPATKAGPQ